MQEFDCAVIGGGIVGLATAWTILTDREHVVRWAWSTHHKTATRVAALLEKHPDLVIVRLTSPNDVERCLAGCKSTNWWCRHLGHARTEVSITLRVANTSNRV